MTFRIDEYKSAVVPIELNHMVQRSISSSGTKVITL